MRALLWKDFHVNRHVLAAAAVAVALPYVMFFLMAVYEKLRYGMVVMGTTGTDAWAEVIEAATLAGLLLTVLTGALLAGNAIAGERADRSAEFLASLPVSRAATVLSKLTFTMGTLAAIWLLESAVAAAALSRISPRFSQERPRAYACLLAATAAAYGVAWLLSSLIRKPAVATAAGAGSAFLVLVLLLFRRDVHTWPVGQFEHRYIAMAAPLGLSAFLVGTVRAFLGHRP